MVAKLTEAQRRVLERLLRDGPEIVLDWRTGKTLLRLGYISQPKAPVFYHYYITDAGRKALEEARNG